MDTRRLWHVAEPWAACRGSVAYHAGERYGRDLGRLHLQRPHRSRLGAEARCHSPPPRVRRVSRRVGSRPWRRPGASYPVRQTMRWGMPPRHRWHLQKSWAAVRVRPVRRHAPPHCQSCYLRRRQNSMPCKICPTTRCGRLPVNRCRMCHCSPRLPVTPLDAPHPQSDGPWQASSPRRGHGYPAQYAAPRRLRSV